MNKVITLLTVIQLLCACQTNTTEQETQTPPTPESATQAHPTADAYLSKSPIAITSTVSSRSAGGPHDFYSEGDYWWPDPENPNGAYIRRDGKTNPDNFVAHRHAMVDLSKAVSALVAAYKDTGDRKYATKAMQYLRTWFLDPQTSMTPHLLYAQAISGKVTGRGIGIIDTIHLIEVAKAIEVLRHLGYLAGEELVGLTGWFDQYLTWMTTHEYGLDEQMHGNNHSTWYAAQVAAFAALTGRETEMELARQRFKALLPAQMNEEGGFIDELKRTKPYIYELFHLEGYAILAEIASSPTDNLWAYTENGRSLKKGWDFMLPYLEDKASWPYPPDVQNFDEVPLQTVGLLLAARAYDSKRMMKVWSSLSPEQNSPEIERNFPVRRTGLWVD